MLNHGKNLLYITQILKLLEGMKEGTRYNWFKFCLKNGSWHLVLECSTRGECACNPVRSFAILSTQRSGSGWFETLLNSHINITSNGEIFSVKVRRSNTSTIMDTLDKLYNLDWFTSASKKECTAAVGLKWMLNQVGAGHLNYNHDMLLILIHDAIHCLI